MKNGVAFWVVQILAGVGVVALGTVMSILMLAAFLLFLGIAWLWALGCIGLIAGQIVIGRVRVIDAWNIVEEMSAGKSAKTPGTL